MKRVITCGQPLPLQHDNLEIAIKSKAVMRYQSVKVISETKNKIGAPFTSQQKKT